MTTQQNTSLSEDTTKLQKYVHEGPIDANVLEALAKQRPGEILLNSQGILTLLGGIRQLEAEIRQLKAAPQAEPQQHSGYVSAELPPNGWQPIETAPKNGCTLLLGYWNSHGNWLTLRGQWFSEEVIYATWEDPDLAAEGWYETPVEINDTPNCFWTEPTHWQPLPSGPDRAARAAPTQVDAGANSILRQHAEGRVHHVRDGLCPDEIEGHTSRDPECPVCQALSAKQQLDLAAQGGQEAEPVAWFAFGDSNGPVPLELYGWDEKACKHAVLTYAREDQWKGSVEGYLLKQGWTLRPVYTHPPRTQGDAARLSFLEESCCDLRSQNIETGGDDGEVRWVVIEHHMARPHEREIGRGDTPRAAIDAAIARQGGKDGA